MKTLSSLLLIAAVSAFSNHTQAALSQAPATPMQVELSGNEAAAIVAAYNGMYSSSLETFELKFLQCATPSFGGGGLICQATRAESPQIDSGELDENLASALNRVLVMARRIVIRNPVNQLTMDDIILINHVTCRSARSCTLSFVSPGGAI